MSVRFSICFIQMPERRDRFESRSSSARAKGDRHPFEWCNSQPASAAMSSKIPAFAPIFAASLGELGRRLSRMLGLIAQPKAVHFRNRRMIDHMQITRLANGLTILTEHMPGLRSVSFGIWVRQGSRHETPALNGICHFIEHALFKGTQRRSARQIATESDRLGGHLDAYTSHEITGFALKVVDAALPEAFDLLADMLANPRFDPDDLTLEQGVIIEEMKMIGDTPDELLNELFHAAYFPGHSLGRPIEGTEETVSSFDRAITAGFHSVAYSPRNLVVAAAGNVTHAELADLAAKTFGDGSNQSEGPTATAFSPETAA